MNALLTTDAVRAALDNDTGGNLGRVEAFLNFYATEGREALVETVARTFHEWHYMGCVQWEDDPSDTATSGDPQLRTWALDLAERVVTALFGEAE